jgi:hypothetical protein
MARKWPHVFIATTIMFGHTALNFWYRWSMEPTEEQLIALGNYRDIIIQHASKVAEAIGVSPETLTGWTEGNGEPTSEQAGKSLDFLREKNKAG